MSRIVIDQKEWEDIRNVIKAPMSPWTTGRAKLDKIHDQFSSGDGITWSDVHKIRELWRSEVPFIDEKGNPFTLFIYDQSGENFRSRWPYNNSTSDYKYHFTWCQALESMAQAGRRGRYKAKYDLDNNVFTVSNGRHDVQKEMNVCKFCLGNFNYKNYSSLTRDNKEVLYKEFEPAIFFSNNLPKDLIRPSHQFHTGRYTQDWREVSKRTKSDRGNKCEECGSSVHLQTHHIDGIKDNNISTNLKVLCYKHHSEQPYHSHMR